MDTIKLEGNGGILVERVETPRAICLQDLAETLIFDLPMVGPGRYERVMAEIDKKGLRPTTRQTILFADMALRNQNNQYCKDLISKFKNRYFWSATEGLSFNDGIFVYDNINGKMPSTSGELAILNIKQDPRVRFVDKGLRQGVMPISEFLKHPYVIAQAGEDMIDTLGRVAKKCHKTEAYVGYLESANSDTKRYTALDSSWNEGMGLYGGYSDGDCSGYASPMALALGFNMTKNI